MKTVGIDYSMTSPSICVHYGEDWSIRNCQFYFLTDRPKLEGKTNQFNGTLHPIHSCEEQRYDNISNWAMSIIQPVDANRIVLEGYSFGSTGRVFHIAENIGLLKHKMWEAKFKFDVIAPTAIKIDTIVISLFLRLVMHDQPLISTRKLLGLKNARIYFCLILHHDTLVD